MAPNRAVDTQKVTHHALRGICLLAACLVLLFGCAKKTQLVMAPGAPKYEPLAENTPVRIIMPPDTVSRSLQPIAYYRRGTSAIGPCSYSDVLADLVAVARKVGAQTVFVKRIDAPDNLSNCYRMETLMFR